MSFGELVEGAASVQLADVSVDDALQPRARLNTEHVDRIRAALEDGAEVDPVILYRMDGRLVLVDGRHRYHAHQRAGRRVIRADVYEGTYEQAAGHAVAANLADKIGLTTAERRAACRRLLGMSAYQRMSARALGRLCGLHHSTVSKIRSLSGEISQMAAVEVERGGQTYTMRVAPIAEANSARAEEGDEDLEQQEVPGVAVRRAGELRPVAAPRPRSDEGDATRTVGADPAAPLVVWDNLNLWGQLGATARELGRGVLVTPAPVGRQLLDVARALAGQPVQHCAWCVVGLEPWAVWSARLDLEVPPDAVTLRELTDHIREKMR